MDNWDVDYKTVIDTISEPGDPECFYWHLYYKGNKINGGIIEGMIEEATNRARAYQLSYTRDIVLASHVWDTETATWIPKAELGL
jgi:hypothetical protein